MDEYIKREDAIKAITWNGISEPPEIISLTLLTAKKNIRNIHAADVVPKSEVEALHAEIDRLQKHNTEYARKHYDDGYNTAKSEVAREIFEEVDKIFQNEIKQYDDLYHETSDPRFKQEYICANNALEWASTKTIELKKKYTEV